MSDEFRTGRPPVWRVVIYALIAMAIPIYFFYPRLDELSPQLRVLFWFTVVFVGGGMVVYFALIPWIIRRFRLASPERSRFIRPAFIVVMILIALTKLLQMHHK